MLIFIIILFVWSNALTTNKEMSIFYSRIAILALLFISYLGYMNTYPSPLGAGISLYGGLFNISNITSTFNVFLLIITSLILVLTGFYPRKFIKTNNFYDLMVSKLRYNIDAISNKGGEQFKIMEYALIMLFVISGAIFLMASGDLISIFLAIELQSYGLYIICTIYRDSESSTGSGLTYFLLGGLSSCFILLGSALIYVNTGTTSLDNIYLIMHISNMDAGYMDSLSSGTNSMLGVKLQNLQYALVVLSVGFLFKISAAPFHFWSPDVYDGIPTIVTTFVAIIAKISIFIFLLELVNYTQTENNEFSWKVILLLSSLMSLIVGSILGIVQSRIKRLLAYSTISHVGFILLALSINSIESVQSYLFYIIQYTISNLNAFVILLTIGYSLYLYVYKDENNNVKLVEENNSPIQLVDQIKGYFHVNPFVAISLAVTLFSFIGIPPLIGFFAKQMVLSAAIDSGYVFMALLAIITSAIGAGYYLNVIKNIFFYKENYKLSDSILNRDQLIVRKVSYTSALSYKESVLNLNINDIKINSALSVIISLMTLTLSLFIYTPSVWLNLASILSLSMFKV